MSVKLYDSELRVMEILWRDDNMTAGQLAKILKEEIGWSRNTTYTVINKCIAKGAIIRYEPHFICKSKISKEQIQKQEIEELIDKMFGGSKESFFLSLLEGMTLSESEIALLRKLVNNISG